METAPAAASSTPRVVNAAQSMPDLYAPVSGKVTAVNASLKGAPEQVNNGPYGTG